MDHELPVNILLVDDHAENLLALAAILSPLGHNLVTASSGTEALRCLLSQDFALVLLDVQMPGIDGFETARLLRGRVRSQDTPIIFLTAVNTSDAHVFHGYAVGAVDYLLKPIVPEILLSKVAIFVDLHRKAEKIRGQAAYLEAMVAELERQIGERQRAEEALRRARDELEQRVRQRTARLAAANEALQLEIVERRRAEEERALMLIREQQARAEAEAAVKVRDQFLSVASHELKTPLTSLMGNVQLLERRAAREGGLSLAERDQRALKVIAAQSTRLQRMIDSLLDISRIQSGQLSIERTQLDVGMLVWRVVAEVQPGLDKHVIGCQVAVQPLLVSGDELRLEQVLQNLLQNAVKYSPEGGTITVCVERRENLACVTVSDQGIGIPSESLPRLFQRFYRAENVAGERISGMGIGLFVVREIVTLHNGRISVESTVGQGSTFRVELPLAEEPALAARAVATQLAG